MEQQETILAAEPSPVQEAEPEQKQQKATRVREVVSVREGRFHAWVRTVAVVGVFAAFALLFLYLAPQLSTLLTTANDALKNADQAITDAMSVVENANTVITELDGIASGLTDTMDETDALVGEARGAIGHLDTVAAQLEDAGLPETFANLNTAVEDFTAVIGPMARFFGKR